MHHYDVVEKSIAELRTDLDSGQISSVELLAAYLNRIAHFDRHGITLNAVPVLNPEAFADARASDERRARGEVLSELDGIPYTAKNSYKARGLTVASGSPAFADLVATDDAFTIAQLRAAGAVLVGLTNMPPMANGGMQRGLYGRAESPYNAEYLTAAFGSGSSNGSGTATAASFAAFGLGEETWSSGRAPASNNGLCAYTPSRGVISVRGNWPLVPTMDVVVPHTRTMDDMLAVLEVVVADDANTRGDFWRTQPWVMIPASSTVRPGSYGYLRKSRVLAGKRFGVPRMYINKDVSSTDRIETRESVIALWEAARADLEAAGASVVEVDFPVVANYESHGANARNLVARGFVPADFAERELFDLSMFGWNDFLEANNDPGLHSLADVDPEKIFPEPTGALPGRYEAHLHRFAPEDVDLREYVWRARTDGVPGLTEIPTLADGVRGLERARQVDLEQWMSDLGLDAVVFPAAADVGPADADVNPESADLAWRNGVWVSNGNLVPRHLGIPTVTVPMGIMADIGMPVGLTFAGRAYDDSALLSYGWAFDHLRQRRTAPPRTPELSGAEWSPLATDSSDAAHDLIITTSLTELEGGNQRVTVESDSAVTEAQVYVNGVAATVTPRDGGGFEAWADVPAHESHRIHSEWREPYGHVVVALARTATSPVGAIAVCGGVH